MTQVSPTDQWQSGWGFDYRSPTGSVNDPEVQTRTQVPQAQRPGMTTGDPRTQVEPDNPPTTGAGGSANTILQAALDQYGLGSLGGWAWAKWQAGESIDQIMLELRETPEYNTRFPGMKKLAQDGHAISESQYINLEDTYKQLGRQFGLPQGFYDDPADFATLITGQVSPTEYQERLQQYQAVAFDVDPTTREELRNLYGIDEGHLAAFAIDPERALPVLQRQFGATQAAAAARRSGFGPLGLSEAESISGVSQENLRSGFGTLVGNRELFNPLAGEAGQGIATQRQLDAAFGGDAAAQQEIEKIAKRRAAAFGGGGQVAQTKQGFAGAG